MGRGGEMERYHRQLLIPVAIEPNSMAPLVLVKENNVNNNGSSDNVSDDRVVVECNSLKRVAQTPEKHGSQKRASLEEGGKKKEKQILDKNGDLVTTENMKGCVYRMPPPISALIDVEFRS